MIDFINSLDENLLFLSQKLKIEGYLNNFENPYIDDNKLKELVINFFIG